MRRWVWRVLLTAAAVLALTGTALAADPAADTVTLDNGVVLTQEGGGWKITGYTGSGGRVVLPSAYDQTAITAIGDAAFKNTNGRKISEVVFPSTITSVGNNAFENCVGLKTVLFLPDSAGDVTIGKSAFSGTGVSTLVLPDRLVTIGESAFANNTSLTKVTIPDSVKTIAAKAFANDKKLKTIYIPEALKPAASGGTKPISANAFANTLLESIHYGGSDIRDVRKYIFVTMPPEVGDEKVHLATDSTHVNPPTCEDDGQVMGGGFCQAAGENQTAACKDLAGGEITINALGHDYQEPEVDKTGHHDCETWTWKYTVTCSRCGAEVERKKVITATVDHTWVDDGTATITKPATCKEEGEKTTPQKCSVCGQAGEPKKESIPKLATHTYTGGKTLEYPIRSATCSAAADKQGVTAVYKVCDVCNKSNECEDCGTLQEALEEARKGTDSTALADAEKVLVDHLKAEHPASDADKSVELKNLDQLEHTRPEPKEGDDGNIASIKPASCTEEGEIVYKADTACTVCGEVLTAADLTVTLEKTAHTPITPAETRTEATCTTEGRVVKHATVCEVCGAKINEGEEDKVEIIDALGHLWSDFVPDEGQDTTPNETCVEKQVTGTVTCTREGCVEKPTERRTLTIEGLSSHNYKGSEWKIVKEPTATEEGLRQRPCMNPGCTHMDEEILPATGEPEDPDDPDDPEDPDDPDEPDEPSKPEEPKSYQVTTVQGAGGTASANRTTARAGDRITITVSPSSGYELDMVRVIASNGKVPQLESLGGGQYRFTMPEANVEIRATFQRKNSGPSWAAAPEDGSTGNPRRTKDVMPTQSPTLDAPQTDASQQLFRDVPMSHWAAGEINWANQMGYMNGTGGRFNPDGVISHQQMWIVLARLTGSNPANMAEARHWAMQGGFADGSAPTGAVKRHQLVTALYRCARLSGSLNQNTTSLAGYTDSRTVPAVARDAFSWALANGIVSGGADKTLNPNGTLTRAQFAVILYRYSQRI